MIVTAMTSPAATATATASIEDAPAVFVDERNLETVDAFLDAIEKPLDTWFRPVVRGFDRIPEGSALVVANHNGGIVMPDLWMIASALRRARGSDQLPYALGHDAALDAPVLGPALKALGGARASHRSADALFRAGKKVLVFPGGDVENLRPFSARDKIVFGARMGYVRLAIRHGVPISPIVTSGAHSGMIVLDDGRKLARALGLDKLRIHVLPTVLTVPWGITIGFPPPYLPLPVRMYIEALAPISFARRGPEAAADEAYVEQCHAEVVRRMQSALERLSAERRQARRAKIDSVLDRVLDRALGMLAPVIDPQAVAPASPPAVLASPAPNVQPVPRVEPHLRLVA
jgi:1-acyl-sn-glycerol-3-phosphate acyltransferase